MKKTIQTGMMLLVLGGSVNAQTLTIDHQPVACAVAERFPRLEARFAPAGTVAVARLLFQGETKDWYSVVMKPDGASFAGILPKPKASLKAFRYYVEVTDKALGTSRTAEYTTNVVGSPGECSGRLMAGTVGSASVLLQAPAGVPALPAGFASTGVIAGSAAGLATGAAGATAGGGGLSTGAVVGIVGGLGAAAGVAVAAGKSNDSSTPASSIPPTPTPTPTPSASGTWIGRAPDGWATFEPSANCGRADNDVDLVLTQTGGALSGTMKWTIRASFFPPDIGKTNTTPLTGTVNGDSMTFSFGQSSSGFTPLFSGTFTSTRLTGSVTNDPCPPGPFAVNRQ